MWLHEAGGRCHEGSQVQISLWPQTREDRTVHESADIGRTGFYVDDRRFIDCFDSTHTQFTLPYLQDFDAVQP